MAKPKFEIDPSSPEPPQLAAIREYWSRQRGGRAMPSRRDVVPSDLKVYLPYILIADVVEHGRDFRYRLVGGRIQGYFPVNPTGKLMSQTLVPFGAETVQQTIDVYHRVASKRVSVRIRGAGAYYAQEPKLFDALLTPLSDDGADANMILGTFLFEWDTNKEFAPSRTGPDEAALQRALSDA
jgi:hypothetical protein